MILDPLHSAIQQHARTDAISNLGLGLAVGGAVGVAGKVTAAVLPSFSRISFFGGSSSNFASLTLQRGEVGFVRGVGVEGAVNFAAKNHISGLRLQQQLAVEEQRALFNSTGGLSQETIKNSRLIIQGDDLGNAQLINDLSSRPGNLSDWGKYVAELIHTPSGKAQVTL